MAAFFTAERGFVHFELLFRGNASRMKAADSTSGGNEALFGLLIQRSFYCSELDF